MAVTPRGEDIAVALREWISDDIKEAPKRIFELGKFLFGVSSGSVGVLVTLSTFSKNAWNWPEWLSLAIFVFSAAIALYIAMPSLHKLSATFDLAKAHARLVTIERHLLIAWGFSWGFALIFAGLGFFELDGDGKSFAPLSVS